MIDLATERLLALPVDQLGLLVLADLVNTEEWHENNYLLKAEEKYRKGEALDAISEALTWLRSRALIARKPGQTADGAIFVTRTGRKVVADGPETFYATERLQAGTHPIIEAKARPQFLIGEYEQGVFVSMKAVEVRVRMLGNSETMSPASTL
ncbi:MAG TPA: hypothetical protein VM848_04650 [Acidimicrobiia bacterium]|nr:hypothetical protein [Acidimicrobiia bacterium]